jgi:hypothetical protein
MAVLDAGDELAEVVARGVLVETARGHNLVEELAASDELEHDEDLGAAGEHLEQIDHVPLLDHLHHGDLLLDLLAHALLLDPLLVEDLDRDALGRLAVDRVLDLAKGAFAERPSDLVLAHLLHHRWSPAARAAALAGARVGCAVDYSSEFVKSFLRSEDRSASRR